MRATRYVLAAVAFSLAPACSDSGDTVVGDPVGDTIADGQDTGDSLANESFDELSGDDYAVVIGKTGSILAALHDGEINQAEFAIDGLIADDIFGFANDLIADHDDANIALDGVVRFYGVGYLASSTADSLALEANSGIGELRAAPAELLDFVFVDLQVRMHASAQVLLDELYTQVGPGEMGDYILDTQDMIDDHLAAATDLLASFY